MSAKMKLSFAFLANTDVSILKLNLGEKYLLYSMPQDECEKLVACLEEHPYEAGPRESVHGFHFAALMPCLDLFNRCYYVIKLIRSEEESHWIMIDELNSIFKILRLFKEGDIYIPIIYSYTLNDDNKPVLCGKHHSFPILSTFSHHLERQMELHKDVKVGQTIPYDQFEMHRYRLKDSEAIELSKFINSIKFPFPSFLQLALDNFNLSYQINNINISFLLLITCLETLFSPSDRDELGHRVSRGVAILLGSNVEDSRRILKEVKQYYRQRSIIVHSGRSEEIDIEDIVKMFGYVRDSIKKILSMQVQREFLHQLLDSKGFGDMA